MYLWLAIDVDEPLYPLRNKATQITKELETENFALTLPLHISLKISFRIGDDILESVIDRIGSFYMTLRPFSVTTQCIEKNGRAVWLKISKNSELESIHSALVQLLRDSYGVQPHAFDLSFLYHATLFLSNDLSKVDTAYALLRKEPFPAKLSAGKFIIGCSETGIAGSFRVIREFRL